jgi:UDP-glucose 4-epimerase
MTKGPVLITGGAGFIGSLLSRTLVESGAQVVVYDNLSCDHGERLGPRDPRCELVEGDVRDTDRLRQTLRDRDPQVLFHLAAIHFIPDCNARPFEAMDVNVNGTRSVLNACRAHPPAAVVFASTAAIYPTQPGRFSEASPPGPLDVYGSTKLMGEELAHLFARETGVSTVVARLFNAFGPGDANPHLLPAIAAQLRDGGRTIRLGNLDPVRDYIHVRDVVAALQLLAARRPDPFEVFNVGTGVGRSVRQVAEAFGAALGLRLAITQDPALVRSVERLELVADAGRLARETGWEPRVVFEEGLRELVAAPFLNPSKEGPGTSRG